MGHKIRKYFLFAGSLFFTLQMGFLAYAQTPYRCIVACLSTDISEEDRRACRQYCPQNAHMQDPSSQGQVEEYTGPMENCRALGAFTVEDRKCKVDVAGCTQNGQVLIPEGSTATATCDVANHPCKQPCVGDTCPTVALPVCECPTDVNECASDDSTDGRGNYSQVAVVRSSEESPIHSCQKIGATELLSSMQCSMDVRGCMRGQQELYPNLPPGKVVVATCDTTRLCTRGLPPNCGCPTDPNECANDDETDGIGNYSQTEMVRGSSKDDGWWETQEQAPQQNRTRGGGGINR